MITGFVGCTVKLPDDALRTHVFNWISAHLREQRVSAAFVGMGPGIDHWIGWACIVAGVPFCAVLDYDGMQNEMHDEDRASFDAILARASKVEILADKEQYAAPGMYVYARANRNRWIIHASNRMTFVVNSKRGPVVDAIQHAEALEVPYTSLDLTNWVSP